jgi:hypothetical protein
LDGFKNLTSLELYNFYGSFPSLVDNLVNALANCPELKVLGLGMQYDDIFDGMPDDLSENYHVEFLAKLCMVYASRKGTSPLRLNTLRLGHELFLYKHSFRLDIDHMYLSKLVQLDCLKTFHIHNGSINYDQQDNDAMQIDWHQLLDCRSLQQLSVTRFRRDVRNWLMDFGSSIKDLIITDLYSPYDKDLDHFDPLEDVHLSMLFVQSKPGNKRELDNWSDRITNTWDTARIDADVITVLDRLPDGGAHLTRLGLCLDFGSQWVCQAMPSILILCFVDS